MPAHPLAFSSQWFKNGEIVQQIMCILHQSPQGLKSSKIKILKNKDLRKSKKCVQLAKIALCTYVGTFSAVSQYIVGIKITYSKHLCITFIHSFLFYTQLGTGNNLKVRLLLELDKLFLFVVAKDEGLYEYDTTQKIFACIIVQVYA